MKSINLIHLGEFLLVPLKKPEAIHYYWQLDWSQFCLSAIESAHKAFKFFLGDGPC